MFTSSAPFAVVPRILAAGLLGACGLAGAADVALDAQCNPQLSRQQQVLYDKAMAGTDTLRGYISARPFLRLDTYDTAVWAERIEKQQTNCQVALTEQHPTAAGPVATKTADADRP